MTMIDINCDMGESYGRYTIGNDEAILDFIDSCNIACGFHGGDPATIVSIVEQAIAKNKNIGAHPGYPDLLGFGRRSLSMNDEDFRAAMIYQIAALKGITEMIGGRLHHVKAHGALYHDLYNDDQKAEIFCAVIGDIQPDLIIYTNPGSAVSKKAVEFDLKIWIEAFADRKYQEDLSLVPRGRPGAVITEPKEAVRQMMDIAQQQKVTTEQGNQLELRADTICIHGDTETALSMAEAIHYAIHVQK
jgi:UPF0271 protein